MLTWLNMMKDVSLCLMIYTKQTFKKNKFMNWFLLLTFVSVIFLVRFIVLGKPKFDYDKENKILYLWYSIGGKYEGGGYRTYVKLSI